MSDDTSNLFLPEPPSRRMDINPRYTSLKAGETLFRLSSPAWSDSLFNSEGPASRFDHHPKGPRAKHEGYGVCYLAKTLASCIAETCMTEYPKDYQVNGVLKSDRILLHVVTRSDLELLDLTADGPILAGTHNGLLDEYQRRSVTQSWARRFFLNPFDEYRRIDGIQWASAKNGETVCVLYERAADRVRISKKEPISEGSLKRDILRICDRYRIIFNI